MVNTGDESLAAGRWTSMILIGFLTSPVLQILLRQVSPQGEQVCTDDVPQTEMIPSGSEEIEKNIEDQERSSTRIDFLSALNIITPLILGDFFHNFCDGIFIGAAFKCKASFAWKITGITVAHELPQEISDFAVLTKKLNFSTLNALLYNFVSGSSVMLGGMTVMAADTSDLDVGMLLAYGAGNYLYVSTIHLFNSHLDTLSLSVQLKQLLAFAIGCIAIGLILLDHQHCDASHDAGTSGDSHEDH